MTCFSTVLYITCSLLLSLPGTGHPTCVEGSSVAVLAKIQELPESLEGLHYEVEPERQPAEDCTHPIEIIPAVYRYPACLAGNVYREPVEGEEGTIPGREPFLGVCCSQGCRGVEGKGYEHIPFGVPMGYAAERAKRYERE